MKKSTLEEFYTRYYNEIKIYAYSLCRIWAVAEDVASETFVKFMDLSINEDKNARYWLLKVARNLIYNESRRAKRTTEIDESIANDDDNQIEKIIIDETYQSLYKALDALDDKSREVITLFYFEDMSIKDIGDIMTMSEVNVKVTLHRARQTLKRILEE